MRRLIQKAVFLIVLPLAAALAGAAAETKAPLDALRAAHAAGVCVQLGCGDGALTAELAQCGNLLVHALERDEGALRKARELLAARGLYGQASVEHWTSPLLPYADNLVNVVVAEDPGQISEKEILRVLVPSGTAWLRREGKWKLLSKPWPKEFDEWTHRRHGADGDMVSQDTAVTVPTGLRWVAGPPQDPGGKKWYYDHLLVTAGGRNFYVYEQCIVARDAFNGRLLWTKEIKTPLYKEMSGVIPRMSKVCPVAGGDRLFCIVEGKLIALDAATGAHGHVYGLVEGPREILLDDGILMVSDKQAVRAFKEARMLWEWRGEAKRVVAGDGRVFCVTGTHVACVELATGKERWRVEEPKAAQAATCSYGCGVLALERSTWQNDGTGAGIAVLSASDGERLWIKDYKPGMTHYQEVRAFFARDLLWLQLEKGKVGGFEPKTGKLKKEWTSCGGHCATPVATKRYLIAPEIEFTDFETGARSRARMTRSACRNPFVPANGLLYTYPLQCECFPLLRGYMALAGAGSQQERRPAAQAVGEEPARLEKGPAYGGSGGSAKNAGADEWPMYRHDVSRSGSTGAAIGSAGLAQAWQVQLALPREGLLCADWKDNPFIRGPVTQPVAAGGVILAAVPDAHLLVALDAKTGARRWSFIAGGRIDTPPTVFEDLCLFGAHDGWVYCLGLTDGQLAWRFRAAPEERRMMAYGQLESPWPVAGSVLVDGGVAYVVAGRHPASDGGVHVSALQARTARVLWQKVVTDMGVKGFYGATQPKSKLKIGVDYEPVDLLVKDGECIAMSRWRFNPDSGEFAPVVGSLTYEPHPGLAVQRGLWSYGIRQTKMVQSRPPAVFSSSKLHTGAAGDTALLLAGELLVKATADGKLNAGAHGVTLSAPALHDGLIAAYGRIYVSTTDGKVTCFGQRNPAP
ncbi:MAG: PQQ-binding-like beta-propeller repeat protein [Planctomycetota bacterium]|nr:PQQ-binding-like beta-propeller repeat protein [Planctomycetota bacterium]